MHENKLRCCGIVIHTNRRKQFEKCTRQAPVLRKAEEMNTPRDRQNVEAVLQVSVKANDELYREIRRDANMCDALRELMKDDLEDARKLGESEGEVLSLIHI